jgi:pimeloyl-ACP methyl ester carboxylesterase
MLLSAVSVGNARRELLINEDAATRVLFGIDRDSREAQAGVPREDRAAGFMKSDETTEPQRTLPPQITGSGGGKVRRRISRTPPLRLFPFLAGVFERLQNDPVTSPSPHPVTRTPVPVRLPEGRLEAFRLVPNQSRAGLPPIVFLHDALGSVSLWRDLPERLCGVLGREGFAFDRLGFGRSDLRAEPPDHRFLEVEATQRLPEVLRQAGIERPVLFGHSDGASIALLFAAAFPDVPAAVVSIAAHVFIEDVTLAGIDEAVVSWRTTDLPSRLGRHHGERTESVFRAWSETWRDPRFRQFSAVEAIRSIRCPVLVIQGEKDEYGTAAQVEAIAMAVSGPVRSLILPGLGHFPHRENPERILLETERFLSEFGA